MATLERPHTAYIDEMDWVLRATKMQRDNPAQKQWSPKGTGESERLVDKVTPI